jgi:NhaA family Na+:H+ antiporter
MPAMAPEGRRDRTGHRRWAALASAADPSWVSAVLRKETVGGVLLVGAAALALVLANSPLSPGYFALRDLAFGYAPWHLELSVGQWAAEGLLAVFFYLAGLELKREIVLGGLRRPATAIVPVVAAAGGVVVPALIYSALNWGHPETLRAWAVPTATDIAFAVAVLALIGSHLPAALRLFLLTLAVVDDLIAIGIIAVVYTSRIDLLPLVLFLVPAAAFGFLAQRYRRFFRVHRFAGVILLPLAVAAWALLHASGVHATVAGVVLGFTVPVLRSAEDAATDDGPGLAEVSERRVRPLSAGFAVPAFAFFSAGVAVGGMSGFLSALADPVTVGIVVALVAGKPIGILGSTWLLTRFTRARLDSAIEWIDLVGVALLAGIGFTVSLLIAGLSFGAGSAFDDRATVAVLIASVIATLLAAAVLVRRDRSHARASRG